MEAVDVQEPFFKTYDNRHLEVDRDKLLIIYTMGKNNSSDTRVKPLAKALMNNHDLLGNLLQLVGGPSIDLVGTFCDSDIYFRSPEDCKKEKALYATVSHLLAILDLIKSDSSFRALVRGITVKSSKSDKRKQLFDYPSPTLSEAEEIVRNNKRGSRNLWAYFEGPSYPDLFIENEKYIILVEGKRTEAHTTNNTTYLQNRSQMVRHIENTLDYCNRGKIVIAFYIVNQDCHYLDSCKKEALSEELEVETIAKSPELKTKILDSFYGYTTWEAISKKIKIQFD